MENDDILWTDKVKVEFGGITALNDVSVKVKTTEIRGIIGPNGAGKTTLFNAITRFVNIASGKIYFQGEDITGLPPHAIARKGIIRSFQKRAVVSHLTAMENVLTGYHRLMGEMGLLDICLRTPRFKKIEGEGILHANRAIEAVGLSYAADKLAGDLSFGEQTLIEIARTLVSRPKLLLLDEPAAGLSSAERMNLGQILKSLPLTQSVSIMVTDHIMDFLTDICDNLTVLNFGEILEEGDVQYIRTHPGVLEAYFGKV
jgi:branched-chain amino acid transport system ATP-binding protein